MIDSKQDEAVKLEACPFCGAPAEAKDYGQGRKGVQCSNADCRAHSMLSLPGEDAVRRWNTRATPANLNAPDKQEALAGEGVEVFRGKLDALRDCQMAVGEGPLCEEDYVLVRLDRLGDVLTGGHDLLDTLPSNEALAGDDRNGVEGAFSWETRADHGDDSLHHMIDHEDGDLVGEAATPEWAEQIANALNATALSRTPSSPQADEADVERVARERLATEYEALGMDSGRVRADHLSRLAYSEQAALRALIATMTTRPAGGEEVEKAVGRVESAIVQVDHRRGAHGIIRVHLADAKTLIAALTKPAALPKEGEEALAIALGGYATLDDFTRTLGDVSTALAGQGAETLGEIVGRGVSIIRALSSLPVRSGEVEKLREALRLAEEADNQRDHCEECNGEDLAELCAECFPSADAARLARWEALGIRAALAPPPQAQEKGEVGR